MTIPEAIYVLCAGTSLVAAYLLLRRYVATRSALLLWSFVGFAGLAINNVLVYIDLVVVRTTDLALARTIAGAVGLGALVYGLIWKART
jgi:hypothetical protein